MYATPWTPSPRFFSRNLPCIACCCYYNLQKSGPRSQVVLTDHVSSSCCVSGMRCVRSSLYPYRTTYVRPSFVFRRHPPVAGARYVHTAFVLYLSMRCCRQHAEWVGDLRVMKCVLTPFLSGYPSVYACRTPVPRSPIYGWVDTTRKDRRRYRRVAPIVRDSHEKAGPSRAHTYTNILLLYVFYIIACLDSTHSSPCFIPYHSVVCHPFRVSCLPVFQNINSMAPSVW